MRLPPMQITQSKYYSPAFNAAIFDGPLRIYYAQYQEAFALKLYFHIQTRLQYWLTPILLNNARTALPQVFILLYPTEEIFANGFSPEQVQERVVCEPFLNDHVIGVYCPLNEEDYHLIFTQVERVVPESSYNEKPTVIDLSMAEPLSL